MLSDEAEIPRGQCPPTRRERKAAETRDRIFRAAIDLIAQHGTASVTVEQITELADVGKGTFFNYFPNKEAVLTYFGGMQVQRLREALDAGEIVGTPRECVQNILRVLISYPGMTPSLARGLFINALSNTRFPDLEAPNIWHIAAILADVIRTGQAEGVFDPAANADEAALFMLGQYFLALLSWCTGFGGESLESMAERYVDLGLRGLAPQSA